MNPFEQSRRNLPIPSGSIPYGPFVHRDGDLVYSVDKFRPRFPLRWGSLDVKRADGSVLPFTDDNVLAAVNTLLRHLISGVVSQGVGKIGGNLYWWSFGGVLVTLQKFKPFGSDIPNYSLLMEFNPNKHMDNPVILDLIGTLKVGLCEYFVWHNTRMDFALDIPYPIKDVRLLTRKVASCYEGTYYFGSRGKSGYTRVYDKRKQLIDVYRQDIGREVTRIEWESRSGDPVYMDHPHIIGDLGRYEVLRFVAMSDWPAALKTFDAHTAAKIRRSLTPIEVDQTVFDKLSADLLAYLGLDPAANHDHYERDKLHESDSEDLEKIQATLRRWAKIKE